LYWVVHTSVDLPHRQPRFRPWCRFLLPPAANDIDEWSRDSLIGSFGGGSTPRGPPETEVVDVS
jgi:hypothetical protein